MNLFAVFGLPVQFAIDEAALQRRFYELSREYHPDRFAGQGANAVQQSLKRMSEINLAYTTLKDRRSRRAYVLEQAGVAAPVKTALPMELADSWFELQERLLETPSEARLQAEGFRQELAKYRGRRETEAQRLEQAFDAGDATAAGKLAQLLHEETYLESLQRDLDSKLGKG